MHYRYTEIDSGARWVTPTLWIDETLVESVYDYFNGYTRVFVPSDTSAVSELVRRGLHKNTAEALVTRSQGVNGEHVRLSI